jgi:hypothetical protein
MYPESAEMFQRVHRQVGLHRIWMHIHRSGCDLGIWGKVEENWPELFIYKVCFHIYIYIYIYIYICLVCMFIHLYIIPTANAYIFAHGFELVGRGGPVRFSR